MNCCVSRKQVGVQINHVPGIFQGSLVKGLMLHITLLVSPCPTIFWLFAPSYYYKTSTTFLDGVNGYGFTSAWLCPVERLPSGLNVHGALATISAPIRSGPSFPYSMCQWASRLSRVKFAIICGVRSVLRRWSICKRRCEGIRFVF